MATKAPSLAAKPSEEAKGSAGTDLAIHTQLQAIISSAVGGRIESASNLSPRKKYNKNRKKLSRFTLNLIMTLDVNQIKAIRESFNGEGLSLDRFVEVMCQHLRRSELGVDDKTLVHSLIDLFSDMDLDGDQSLEFEEFFACIIHMGMGAAENFSTDPIKSYKEGPVITNFSKHQTDHLISYLTSIDTVLVVESLNGLVKMCDPETLRLKKSFDVTAALSLAMGTTDIEEDTSDGRLSSATNKVDLAAKKKTAVAILAAE
jgi:hypothetical protein